MVTVIALATVLRYTAFLLLFFWWIYWRITEIQAQQQKPKHQTPLASSVRAIWIKFAITLGEIVLGIQLLGWDLLPMVAPVPLLFALQIAGFVFLFGGFLMAIVARKTLGANWSHAAEYQVKANQELITTGVFSIIRHPIYVAMVLAFIGGELLVNSYVVFIGLLLLLGAFKQAEREEQLLAEHFGTSYKQYQKRTKMFVPYLW